MSLEHSSQRVKDDDDDDDDADDADAGILL